MADMTLERATEEVRTILRSQYHASLAMLRGAIEKCPDSLWVDTAPKNPFWLLAYHTLYFAHLYVAPRVEDFKVGKLHQRYLEDFDENPTPSDLDVYLEGDSPPRTGEPISKAEIMEYLDFCEREVDAQLDGMDLWRETSGFWYKVPKLEHQVINIRHIQHHAAQLADRVRAATATGVDWAGARRKPA